MKSPWLSVNGGNPPTAGTTCWSPIHTGSFSSWGTSGEADRAQVIPCNLTIDGMYFEVATAPGTSPTKTWTYVLVRNGVAQDGTGGTFNSKVAIAGSATVSSIVSGAWTTGLYCIAGDVFTVQCSGDNGSMTGSGEVRFCVTVDAGAHRFPFLAGTSASLPTGAATNYLSAYGANTEALSTTVGPRESLIGASGTIDTLYAKIPTAPGASKSHTFCLMLDGVAQDGTGGTPDTSASISGVSATSAVSTGTPVTVTAGQRIAVRCVSVGSSIGLSTYAKWAMVFHPTTDGESFLSFGNDAALSTSTRYEAPNGFGGGSWTTTQTDRRLSGFAGTAKALYARLTAWTTGTIALTLVKGGSATTQTVAPAAAATLYSDTAHEQTIVATDTLAISALRQSSATDPTGVQAAVKLYIRPSPYGRFLGFFRGAQ